MRKVGLTPDQVSPSISRRVSATDPVRAWVCFNGHASTDVRGLMAAAAGDPQGVSYGLTVLEMVYQVLLPGYLLRVRYDMPGTDCAYGRYQAGLDPDPA
eukprot:3702028-Rhodomonas_salina.1